MRLLATLLLAALLALAATAGAAAAVWHGSGRIHVELVESDGDALSVGAPALLADLSIALLPDDVFRDAPRELRTWLSPVRRALAALDGTPDFVLLDVRGTDGTVRIAKQGDRIRLEVDAPDGRVRAELPLHTFRSLLLRVERACAHA